MALEARTALEILVGRNRVKITVSNFLLRFVILHAQFQEPLASPKRQFIGCEVVQTISAGLSSLKFFKKHGASRKNFKWELCKLQAFLLLLRKLELAASVALGALWNNFRIYEKGQRVWTVLGTFTDPGFGSVKYSRNSGGSRSSYC